MSRSLRWRSVLFTPATRPDRTARLAATAADVTVLDLEDAVPVGEKDAARDGLEAFASAVRAAGPSLVVLARVNPVTTPWFAADVEAAAAARVAGVVLPKVAAAGDAVAVADAWRAAGGAGEPVILAGIETAAGVEAGPDILRGGGFAAAYFGAEDYIADLGGRRSDDSLEVLYARSRVAMAAAIGGVDAIDQVVVRYRDFDAFRAEAGFARDLGYRGKLCIHPDQVGLAHAAFTPSPEEVTRARALLDALAAAGGGVAAFEGQMIDAPAVAAAEKVLALAEPDS
ncbi:CoA ester lyase [Acidiferrimicrobium sp. IK]|uniref:HpcH/HpaI aldolase/citrate lyase family protein n=1 Tax=Acidiferrimicrobium sp. IK TaxID=2871700 RepID=UPI0021CAFD3D|nr:CoA ester lyase [Acidiferrimicrobium sp. IK]MCU4184504.1 CoA ester lyase [Acidiferrimicrobium sp. IK]